MNLLLKNITALRNIIDNIERGYKFEQIIREIQPWDRKPPVVASLQSEQIDGIFIWKDQAYLIESKAKKEPITVGSHDWEDFELKIRRRKNSVIGLFCSLYMINNDIYTRAEQLNLEGHFIIILSGNFWDELEDSQLPLKDVLDYMNLFGRIKFLSKPPQLSKIQDWYYSKEDSEKKIIDASQKNSSAFLRRYKSPFHDNIYIGREIDHQLEAYSKDLKPSSLRKVKEKPKQICVVRDYSGSGKTTLSLQISQNYESYFGTGITANENDIDIKFEKFFNLLGERLGLFEILSTNKPIVFVIDSLDEASYDISKKRKEILSIFKFIDEYLNVYAEKSKLLVFPLLVVFTVREDYWRDWEALFEGRRRNDVNKKISVFGSTDFEKALEKYSLTYNYNITNQLSNEDIRVLSSPINLLIFSETYQYQGNITVNQIWEGNVINSYFNRKREDIYKRHIHGFTGKVFLNLISSLSFKIVSNKNNSLHKNDIEVLIKKDFSSLNAYSDEIIDALVSELILNRDSDNLNLFRFRHSRFVEFLLAYYIIQSVEKDDNLQKLDTYAQLSFESGIVLMFRVHDDIRLICKTKFPHILVRIENYYSKSNFFMSKKLLRLRSKLSTNTTTDNEDIALILKNINGNDPELVSEAFFVIAAKNNAQGRQTVLSLFLSAFKTNPNIQERYKLIAKLENHNLLLNENVLDAILVSSIPKDWEVYLGLIIYNNLNDDFIELWRQLCGSERLQKNINSNLTEDWKQTKKLLQNILTNSKYIPGDVAI